MSAPETGPSPPSRGNRSWLALALVASLGFNLVILGAAVAERIWSHHGEHGRSHLSIHVLPHQFFAGLDRPRREELRDVFRARRPEYRDERRALRQAASAFADALERQPYDPDATQAAIAAHASRSHRLVDLGSSVAEDLVGALTPEERQALADAIRRRIEERRPRRSR